MHIISNLCTFDKLVCKSSQILWISEEKWTLFSLAGRRLATGLQCVQCETNIESLDGRDDQIVDFVIFAASEGLPLIGLSLTPWSGGGDEPVVHSCCRNASYIHKSRSSVEDTIARPSCIISMRNSTTSDLCSAAVRIIERTYSFSFFHSLASDFQPRYKERNNDHMYVCQRNKCQTQLDYTPSTKKSSFLKQIFQIMRNKLI